MIAGLIAVTAVATLTASVTNVSGEFSSVSNARCSGS